MKAHRVAANAPASKGSDDEIPAWAADPRHKAAGQEFTADEKRAHEALVTVAKDRELGAWGNSKVSEPARTGSPSKAIADACWALNWKMEGGKKGAKARLVAKGYQNPNLRTGSVETSG